MLRDFIKVKGGFVKAVEITHDFHDATINKSKVECYFVNPTALGALHSIAKGLHPSARQRAHIISGTYGSGKSHLGLVLANYLSRPSSSPEFEFIFRRIEQRKPDVASEIKGYRDTERPYLLVLLEGADPDGAEHSLLDGLRRALREAGLAEDVLQTSFDSATRKIAEWEGSKPDFADQLKALLDEDGHDLAWLRGSLSSFDRTAYDTFKRAYKVITTGDFVPEFNETAVDLYRGVSRSLCAKHGYCGIAVIWDQFNDHLQTTSPDDLSREAGVLRAIAEAAERSGEHQLHLVFISHHSPRAYVQEKVSKEALDSWVTVEGRFKQHAITAVDDSEELLGYAITKTGKEWQETCRAIEHDSVTLDRVLTLGLYPDKDKGWLAETLYKGGYPLHPLAVYCLPRLADVVGQEFRTMFTFLEDAEKEGGLARFIGESDAAKSEGVLRLYYADRLFDYFEDAISGNPDTRRVATEYGEAVGKLRDRSESLTVRVLKSIALLRTIERNYRDIPLRSTPEGLSAMLAVDEAAIQNLVRSLEKNGVLWKQTTTGAYSFRTGREASSFEEDYSKALREVGTVTSTHALQQRIPACGIRTRKYTEAHGVVERVLEGAYVLAGDLANASWREEHIKREFLDGIVLRVLAESEEDLVNAKKAAVGIKNQQVVVAIPSRALRLNDPLRSLRALDSLKGKPAYEREDSQLHSEWSDRFDSEKKKLDSEMLLWADARNSAWFSGGQPLPVYAPDEAEVADVVMARVFARTPRLAHRRIANSPEPDQRSDRIRLSTMILDSAKPTVDITASGGRAPAEQAILEGVFDPQGMLSKRAVGNSVCYELEEPKTDPAAEIWGLTKQKLAKAGGSAEFEGLVNALRLPPYGLSTRVIELFVAAFMRLNPNRFTVRTRKSKSAPIEVRELNGDTIFEIVKDPNPDKVVVEYRAQLPLEVEFLETIATVLVRMRDLGRAPRLDQVATLVHDYYAQVPTVTLRASDLAEKGRSLLNVLAGFQGDNDVVELLFKALPSALGIGKELALWSRDDTALIVDFETALRESVEAVDGYPKRVADRVLETVADIFDVRGHAKPDIVAKVENWYRSLDPSVKEARFRGDAEHLLKCCNLTSSDDVEQRFLTDLPGEFALKAYTEWEDVSNALESYRSKMQSAKVEIEKRQRRAAPPPPTTRLPREAEQLLASLRDRIHKSRKTLSSLEVIRVLEALLAECRKAAESRK